MQSCWVQGLPTNVPVIDAIKAIEFKIKRSDVNNAVARNPEMCVAAQGLKRIMNGRILGVKIGATTAKIHYGDHIVRYQVSKETAAMIKAYDQLEYYPTGVVVKLMPPSPCRRLGAKKRNPAKTTGNKSRPNQISKSPWLRHIDQGV